MLSTRRDPMSRCRARGTNGDSHASISDLLSTVVLLKVVVLKEFVLKELSLLFKELSLLLKDSMVLNELSLLLKACAIFQFSTLCELREQGID